MWIDPASARVGTCPPARFSMVRRVVAVVLLAVAVGAVPGAWAHASPDHSSPMAGSTVAASPGKVSIWFNGPLEPVFSKLVVKDAAGKVVSRGPASVGGAHGKRLTVPVEAALPEGDYQAVWSVISHDGHHTEGHFRFSVEHQE